MNEMADGLRGGRVHETQLVTMFLLVAVATFDGLSARSQA